MSGMNAPADAARVGVLAVMDRQIDREYNPFEPDNQSAEYPRLIEARAAVAELIEAAGKAQDTNREDYVLGRPDVSHLPDAERESFLRGWDAASEAVFRTGLRAALARMDPQS